MATLTEREALKRRFNIPNRIADKILDEKISVGERFFLLVQSMREDDPLLRKVLELLNAAMEEDAEGEAIPA